MIKRLAGSCFHCAKDPLRGLRNVVVRRLDLECRIYLIHVDLSRMLVCQGRNYNDDDVGGGSGSVGGRAHQG
jgi:hypothetical protein